MSKGSKRRPSQVPREEVERRWEETFGKGGSRTPNGLRRVGKVAGFPLYTHPGVPDGEVHMVQDGRVVGRVTGVA